MTSVISHTGLARTLPISRLTCIESVNSPTESGLRVNRGNVPRTSEPPASDAADGLLDAALSSRAVNLRHRSPRSRFDEDANAVGDGALGAVRGHIAHGHGGFVTAACGERAGAATVEVDPVV